MNCPICDNAVPGQVLRCPHCGSPLTIWKNLDMYADQAYRAALDLVARGDRATALEMLGRAVTFAPADARYVDGYGRLLAQAGRLEEAAAMLEAAHQLTKSDESKAALQWVKQQLKTARSEPGPQPARTPLALGAVVLSAELAADGEEAVDDAVAGTPADPWQQCFQIESNWQESSAFAPLLHWDLQPSAEVAPPLAYLRGVEAYVSGDDLAARQQFESVVGATGEFGNADVYLLLLSAPETVDQTLRLLSDRGRTPAQLACVLAQAAEVAAVTNPAMVPHFLVPAVRHTEGDWADLGGWLLEACHDHPQPEVVCSLLETCLAEEESLRLRLLLGDLRWQLDDREAAEQAYLAAAESEPDAWQVKVRMARLKAQDSVEDSLAYVCSVLEDPGLDEDGIFGLIECRLQLNSLLGRKEAALADARELARRKPSSEVLADCVARHEAALGMAAGGDGQAGQKATTAQDPAETPAPTPAPPADPSRQPHLTPNDRPGEPHDV